MLTLLFGIFAFFWSAVFAAVGASLFLVFVIPLILFFVIFRVGLLFIKLAAAVVLLALLSVSLF